MTGRGFVAECDVSGLSSQARRIVEHLGMQPIPHEGAWFAPMYRAQDRLGGEATKRFDGERVACSSIITLITRHHFSAMHRLRNDELWHYQSGAPLRLVLLEEGGKGQEIVLGPDIFSAQHLQVTVPAGTWMGAMLASDSHQEWSLIGNVVIPGFEYDDYEAADREHLIAGWPSFEAQIRALTR